MRGVSPKKLKRTLAALKEQREDVTIYEAIRIVAPAIKERAGADYPRRELYRMTAGLIGCSEESVARYYREIEGEEASAKRGASKKRRTA
jgi:threonine synthase